MVVAEAVNHMSIPVNDIERAKKFYIDLLGMKPIIDNRVLAMQDKPFVDPLAELLGVPDTPICRLECGGVEVTLFQRPKPLPVEVPVQENGKLHYSYRMNWENLHRLCEDVEALRQKGYNIPFDPLYRHVNQTIYLNLYVFDPDGNLFEVIGWPPQAAHEAQSGTTGHPVNR